MKCRSSIRRIPAKRRLLLPNLIIAAGVIVAVKYVQCMSSCPYESEICKSPVNDSGARKIL
jgi:hypothetical protein